MTSIFEETRDDRLPEEASSLLDDATIGVKDIAGRGVQQQQLTRITQEYNRSYSETCCRRVLFLNVFLTIILVGFIGFFAVEIGPMAKDTDGHKSYNATLTLPPLPKVPKSLPGVNVNWKKMQDFLSGKPPPLYDPAMYPWAEDPYTFLETLEKGKKAVVEARKAMWDAREPNAEAMFQYVNIWNEEHLVQKFNEKILKQSKFVIGVMGTSVTAGHDNFFNQSFPVVWGVLMENAMLAAGVELDMRNQAMGWNPINPSYFCVGELTGMDVDMTMWEFGMMGGDDSDLEQWIRSSLLLPNQPHMLICDPGEGCRDSRDDKGELHELEKRTDPPPQPWKHQALDWYIDDGFSFATNELRQNFMFLDHLIEYQYGTLFAKDKPTAHPAGWHPGPHGHRFRAEILAYAYLGWFEKAVDQVYERVSAKEPDLSPLLPAKLKMPPPTQCQPELCADLATCVTSFEPRMGPDLKGAIIFPKEVPFVRDSHAAQTNEMKAWHEQLYFCDVGAVDYMLQEQFNYKDRKYVIQGEKGQGPVKLSFESTKENYFIACSAPGNSYICSEGTVWKIDGEVVECLNHDKAVEKKVPHIQEPCFITDRKIRAGKHVFELERPAGGEEDPGDHWIPLSHLIYY